MNKEEKHKLLEHILDSETFRKAPTMAVLFRYLVESSIDDVEVNTSSIGVELFGNKYEPEFHDVNIRVNVYHLRKRLTKYYEKEGKDDGCIIQIETGKYNATFEKVLPDEPQVEKRRVIASSVGITLLLLSVFSFFFLATSNTLWTPMFDNGYATALYLDDVSGYSGPTPTSKRGWIRDATINSGDEFYARKQESPEQFAQLEAGEYSFVVFENACTIQPFTRYFAQQDYDLLLRPTSEFSTRSLKNENTIYSGPMHVNPYMVEVFNTLSKRIKIRKDPKSLHSRFYIDHVNGFKHAINFNTGDKTGEYALVASFKGPNDTRHYQFFSNHGMGLTSVVEYFTNTETLDDFTETNSIETDEFIALFFVKGKERTNLSMELVFVEEND